MKFLGDPDHHAGSTNQVSEQYGGNELPWQRSAFSECSRLFIYLFIYFIFFIIQLILLSIQCLELILRQSHTPKCNLDIFEWTLEFIYIVMTCMKRYMNNSSLQILRRPYPCPGDVRSGHYQRSVHQAVP